MAHLLALTPHPAAARALRTAVQREAAGGVFHAVREARGWPELASLAAGAPGAALAVVDPYAGGGLATAEIRRLRERCPALEVVALADFTGCPAADAFSLALAGVREIVCTSGQDAAARVAQALASHLNRGPMERVVEALDAALPASVRRWPAPVLLSPARVAGVAELARAARCSPRTLRRTLHGAGLPTPEELLAWRRLLHAARLLDDGRTADGVARALDFSSGSALRRSLKRHTGLRPGELRERGGFAALAALFLRRCGGAGAPAATEAMAGAGPRMAGSGTGPGAAAAQIPSRRARRTSRAPVHETIQPQ